MKKQKIEQIRGMAAKQTARLTKQENDWMTRQGYKDGSHFVRVTRPKEDDLKMIKQIEPKKPDVMFLTINVTRKIHTT